MLTAEYLRLRNVRSRVLMDRIELNEQLTNNQ